MADKNITIRIGGDATQAQQAMQQAATAATKMGEAVQHAGDLYQDAEGRWRAASGRFASNAEKAAAGVAAIGPAAQRSGAQAAASLTRAEQAARGFIDTLRMGVGIDIGGRLVTGIVEIPAQFRQAIDRGIAFNAEISDSEAGMAKVIGKFLELDDVASRDAAAKAMAQIVELEPRTAGTLATLVQGFMATSASALSTGMSVEQNIDLVGRFANALANANIPAEQLSQELRSIFTGNITADSALAKILQITNQDVEQAKQLGNLYDFLAEKVGKLGEAGDTYGVRSSTFQSQVDKTLAILAKPAFNELYEGLDQLNTLLQDPEIVAQLQALGYEVGQLVHQGIALTGWAIENAPSLIAVAKSAGVLAVAFAALKIKDVIVGLAMMTAGAFRSQVAIDAETAALGRNTAAVAANAASRSRLGAALGRMGRNPIGQAALLYGAYELGGFVGETVGQSLVTGGLSTAGSGTRARGVGSLYSGKQDALIEKGKQVTTEAGRAELLAQLQEELNLLNERATKVSVWDGEEKRTIEQRIQGYVALARAIKLMDLEENKRRLAAQATSAAAPNLAAGQTALAKGLRASDAALALERERNAATTAVDAGDVGGIDGLIRKVRGELATAMAEGQKAATEEAGKAAAKVIADLRARLAELTQARADAEKQSLALAEKRGQANNEAAISGMEAALKLQETINETRLTNLKAAGATEKQIANERVILENDLARKRYEAERRIITLRETDDAARQQALAELDAQFQAEQAGRAAALAAAKKPEEAAGSNGPTAAQPFATRPSGAVVAGGGLVLQDASGKLTPGATVSDLGTISAPSRLDAMGGAGWNGVPRLTQPAEALPLAATPADATTAGGEGGAGADATGRGADAAGKAIAAAEKKVSAAVDKLAGETAQALARIETRVDAAKAAVVQKLAALEQKVTQVESQVANTYSA